MRETLYIPRLRTLWQIEKYDDSFVRHASSWQTCDCQLYTSQIEALTWPSPLPPSGHTPSTWRLSLPGREGIWWTQSSRGRGIWSPLIGVESLIDSLDFMFRVALIPRGLINHVWRRRRRQTLINSKKKITDSWRIGSKPKAFVLLLQV